MPQRHVIVGSGIAGLSAAEAIRLADPEATITMIGEEPHEFYSRPGLAYLLRGDIPERQLFLRTAQDQKDLRMHRMHKRVEKLLLEQHAVQLTNGQAVVYDRLLLATGALASAPPFTGGNLLGVVKLDSLDDTRGILRFASRFRSAVVVGGGITALELAEGLRARGMRVHYFLRGLRYWSDVLDETESEIVLGRLQHEGIRVHLQTQIKRAIGNRGRITAVETEAGKTIPCSLLAVAIGVRPRIDLAREAGLTVDRGIVVNEYLQTSVPDVFASGDAAQVLDPRTGVATLDVLWPIALRQGQIAGANMVSLGQAYQKDVPFNVTQLTGLKTTIIGAVGGGGTSEDSVAINRGESEGWRLTPNSWVLSDRDDVNRVRLLLDDRCLIGALVMGDQAWSRPLHRLIQSRVDITPVRAALAVGGRAALEQLALFYQQWEKNPAQNG